MKSYDVTPVADLLGSKIAPDVLATFCDDACYNLSKFHILNPNDSKYGNLEDQVYFLRELRDIFNQIKEIKQ